MTSSFHATLTSPLGRITLASDGEHLTALEFDEPATDGMLDDAKLLRSAVEQVRAYFAGELRRFDLPLQQPGTEFQQAVWRQLQQIEYGQTASYRTLAAALGRPQAVRAVGQANASNRIPLIVPCHRIIAADGTLGGYRGGSWRKKWLLEWEQHQLIR